MSQKPHINISPLMKKEEGPIPHFSIMKLASLDLMANFSVTIGFSIIGSGVHITMRKKKKKILHMYTNNCINKQKKMYQVIYSSVVVWCAILSWLIMGRVLSKTQWLSILGATVGLGISSLESLTLTK
jgi:hypothetical protein